MAEEMESSAVTGRGRPAEGETHTHTHSQAQLNHISCKNTRHVCHCDTIRPQETSVLLTRLKES